jgi:hypothetical protein
MEIRRKGECNPTIDQNSPDLSDPAEFLAHPQRAPHMYCTNLHSNRVITPPTYMRLSTQKAGNGRCGVDNNELRGHMIPVPVFGFCHCSPERRFCLVVVNHLNNSTSVIVSLHLACV